MPKVFSLSEVAIIVDQVNDNVAVSKADLAKDTSIAFGKRPITLKQNVSKGHRFAIKDIPKSQAVLQYNYPFAASLGIKTGDLIHTGNIRDIEIDFTEEIQILPPDTQYDDRLSSITFDGFLHPDGRAGTRNYYLIVPTSQCASQTASLIASEATAKFVSQGRFRNIDGITSIPNTEGCGCASNVQIERFLRVLQNFISHPNIGAALIIDLGCEQTNYQVLDSYLKKNKVILHSPPDWLTIQEEGGTKNTIEKALSIIEKRLPEADGRIRTKCPLKLLTVGTECGASDAFSGITANPVIGKAIDNMIAGGGSGILSEVTEMLGAEHILLKRMKNKDVAGKFLKIIEWYRNLATKLDVDISDNLVPENIEGGLINSCIKSLGAITKGGTSAIEDVLDYGERLKKRGLNIMQGPGNDIESITGIVSSGANIVCFSTGKGTVTGDVIVPVIKISSTTDLFIRMPGDIDFDAGRLLDIYHNVGLDELGSQLTDRIVAVASGEKTKSEENKQAQFQVWTAGKLSL